MWQVNDDALQLDKDKCMAIITLAYRTTHRFPLARLLGALATVSLRVAPILDEVQSPAVAGPSPPVLWSLEALLLQSPLDSPGLVAAAENSSRHSF